MAIQQIRIGSAENVYQYDDVAFASGIETTGPINAGVPVAGDDVLRLDDIGGGGGLGDVQGPGASTDNALARFNGAGGKTIQNSTVIANDADGLNIPTGEGYKVAGTQVVTDQQVAEADAAAVSAISLGAGADSVDRATFNTDLTAMVAEINALRTTINNLLAKLRTHGLIDT